jgi:RNA polymerase sigma-70 factor (ECF subfamily)
MCSDRLGGDPLGSASSRKVDLESTTSLVERARAGDQEALDRLMARHLTPLRRWARGRLPQWARDAADTDDLVQDALLHTFKRLGEFEARGPGALLAYLRQVIVNRVRDELRRKGRRPEETDLDGLEVALRRSPLEEAIGPESVARYERALASLTPGEREAIIGRVEMGYSYAELADVLGRPSPDAARKAAQRALVRLARAMDLPGT